MITIGFNVLIFIGIIMFAIALSGYMSKMQVLKGLWLKHLGKAKEYSKVKEKQIKKKLREDVFNPRKEKLNLLDRAYIFIAQTGIAQRFPTISVSDILIIMVVVYVLIGIIAVLLTRIPMVGVIAFAMTVITTVLVGNAKIRGNTRKIDNQMTLFINTCYSVSDILPNIIDIFGHVYPQMESPLNKYLEECYLEAKQEHNNTLALRHLKEKSDSFIFRLVIDAFEETSNMNEDYRNTIDFLRPIAKRHDRIVNNQNALIRNMRVRLGIMFIMGFGILYFASEFTTQGLVTIFSSAIGYALLAAALLVIIIGLTMHPKQ